MEFKGRKCCSTKNYSSELRDLLVKNEKLVSFKYLVLLGRDLYLKIDFTSLILFPSTSLLGLRVFL
jgi:hypothetical protein